MRLRVVSWNIHSCIGVDGRYDPARTGEILSEVDADIIGLQEVDWRRDPHEGVDQFAYLARYLNMTPIRGPNLRDHRGHYGNGLLTRLAVRGVDRIDLAHAGREPRGAIDAHLSHDGRPVRVVVTHLGLRSFERRRQLVQLREAIGVDSSSEVRLLLADMNEWSSRRRAGGILTPGVFSSKYAQRSYPSRCPLLALDWIFVSPVPSSSRLTPMKSRKARAASDHLPVVGDFEWEECVRTRPE